MANGFLHNLARDLHLPKPPFWMVAGAITFVTLTWVPLALIARARVTVSAKPRVHLVQDMDNQPKHGAQSYSPVFADHRAARQPVEGTVARGELNENGAYVHGFVMRGETVEYIANILPEVKVDKDLLLRGQTVFNIYCSPCHGMAGHGDGPIHDRVANRVVPGPDSLGTTWSPPANLHATVSPEDPTLKYAHGVYPDGKLFNVISNGFNNMAGYKDQIGVHDRWAVVAYVRALQATKQPQPPAPQAAAQ